MKLLVWYWGRNGGGATYSYNLAKALKEIGADVHISISKQASNYNEFKQLNIPTYDVDTFSDTREAFFSSLTLPLIRRKFVSYLKKHKVKVVLSSMHHVWNPFVAKVLKKEGIYYLATVHDFKQHLGEENIFLNYLARRDMHYADSLIALTNHVAEQIKVSGVVKSIFQIPHGAFCFCPPRVRRFESRKNLKLLFWGRIHKYKGIDLLLDAYGMLKANFNVTLSIYGSGDISPYLSRLQEFPDITLVNRWIEEDEIGDILDLHDVCVIPYIDGSQSGIIPAALYSGLPVVATPVAGIKEQLPDKLLSGGGCIADVSAAAIAERVASFFESPNQIEKESVAAIHYAKNYLGWKVVAVNTMSAVKATVSTEQ